MEAIREKWSGIEYSNFWSRKKLASALGQAYNDENGDVIQPEMPKRVKQRLYRAQKSGLTREEVMARHDTKYVGKTFGQVTVLCYSHTEGGLRHYKCHCGRCGQDFVHSSANLSVMRSCGCARGGNQMKMLVKKRVKIPLAEM